MVYQTSDPARTNVWDGKIRGQDAAQGVYVYVVEFEHEFESGVVSGDVTIIR